MQILECCIKCSIKNIYANFRSTSLLFCVKTCTYITMETNFTHKDVMKNDWLLFINKLKNIYFCLHFIFILNGNVMAIDIFKESHKETEHIKTNYGRSMWNCIIRQLYYIVWNAHTILKCVTSPHYLHEQTALIRSLCFAELIEAKEAITTHKWLETWHVH